MTAFKPLSQIRRRGQKGTFQYKGFGVKWTSLKTNNETIALELQRKWDERLQRSAHGLKHLKMIWGDFRSEYERDYIINAKSSQEKLRMALNSFEAALGITPQTELSSITNASCQKWVSARLQEGVLPQSIKAEKKYIAPFFSTAHKRGYIESDPFAEVKFPRGSSPEAKCLNVREASLTMNAVEVYQPHYWLMAVFAYETGMRVDEIIHQRIEDVDFVNGIINVKIHTKECRCFHCNKQIANGEEAGWAPKGNKERAFPIMPRLLSMLLNLFQTKQTGVIFEYIDNTVRRMFERAYKKAGVTGKVAVHTMRHTLLNDMRQAGVDEVVRKAICGHGKTSVHEAYMHVTMDEMRRAIGALHDWRTGNYSQMVAHVK